MMDKYVNKLRPRKPGELSIVKLWQRPVKHVFFRIDFIRYSELDTGELVVRCTFTMELKADIRERDAEHREAYIEAIRNAAQVLFAQSAMLSPRPPIITLMSRDDENGTVTIDIFPERVGE